MPTIPRINDQRAQNQGLPTVQQSANAPAGAFGPDLSEAANQFSQVAFKIKERADTARVMEADTNLMGLSNRLLYDPDKGALNARGKNALEADQRALAEFDKEVDTIRQNLSGRAQQEAFDKLVRQRRQQIERTTISHVNSEMRTYESQQYDALVEGSVETAANNYTDPKTIGMELKRQRAAIMARAQDQGWPEEQTAQALEAATSATHTSVMQRMLTDKQYDLAREYFEANGEQLEGEQYTRMKGLVEKGGRLRQAQQSADSIMAQYSDEATALKEARKINDPEVRDDVTRRVKARFSEQRSIEKQVNTDAMEAATDLIEGGADIDDIPLTTQEKLNNQQLNALKARAQQIANPEIKNNWQAWTRITTATREELAQIEDPYVELRPLLDDAHYNKALNLINKAKGIKQTADDEFDPSSNLSFLQRAKQTALQAGVIPADKGPSDYTEEEALTYSRFQTEAANRIEDRERDLGRRLTGNEEQAVMDEMLLEKYRVDSGFFGSDQEQFAWALDADDAGDAYVPMEQIPEEDQTFIKNMMIGNGLAPDDELVQKAYAQYKLGDKEAFNRIIQGR